MSHDYLRLVLSVVIGIAVMLGISSTPVQAEAVKIQPLQYQTDLKKGEKKKGFVDITNPSNETVVLKLYANGFSQVDNKGSLTFFKSEQIEKGLLLDYDAVTLDPRQTLRLFFLADGTKLPTGDVFAAIFAETQPAQQAGAATSVRVGTLVMIVNQTPGARETEIANLSVPILQLGDSLQGSMTIKNPAPKNIATGFFPKVSIGVSPWGQTTVQQGPLIFAGNARAVDFAIPSNMFGIYQVKVQANNAEKTTFVFLMTGWWRIIAPVMAAITVLVIFAVKKYWPRRKVTFKHRK